MQIYEQVMAVLAMFTALCVAGGWLIKIIKGLKKPSDTVMEMLDRDNKRLRKLEDQWDYIDKAISLLMESQLAMLGHLETDNNTGNMAKARQDIEKFLIHN